MNWRSIRAIAAAILFVVIVTTAVDIVLHLAGVYPPMPQPLTDRLALLASAYRIPIGIAGGWTAARLAPRNPMTHAMALGYVGIVLALIGLGATWNAGLGPKWYSISLVVLAIPECWAGGKLYTQNAPGRSAVL